jgi:hypothetical protein
MGCIIFIAFFTIARDNNVTQVKTTYRLWPGFANNNILLGVILDHGLGKMTRKSANVNNTIIST